MAQQLSMSYFIDGVNSLHGRRVIYSNVPEITPDNVRDVLQSALSVHQLNRAEIEYLYNYERGIQPVLGRTKGQREDICNKIVMNLASSTTTFKTASFIGDPLQYVSRGVDVSVPEQIERLNSYMMSEGKASKDMDLAHWMFTCGLGYRLVLRDKADDYVAAATENDVFDEAPFEIYTLDPRDTFVIRSTDVTRRVLAAVTCARTDDGDGRFTVYTPREKYIIKRGFNVTAKKPRKSPGEIESMLVHGFGYVPIVEYQCNPLRMGAFEPGIDVLNAINIAQSDRMDGVDQFIQAVMVFENVDITKEQLEELKTQLALKITSKDGNVAKVYYLNEQLDQTQTQVLVDDLKLTYYEIVGMPSQGNGSTGDSSNNGAIAMKNGWYSANSKMLETDGEFRIAETETLKIVLQICRDVGALDLRVSQVDMKFGLRAYEDMLTKTQSFTTLMGAGCSPLQAAKISCITADPETFAIEYESYSNRAVEKELETEQKRLNMTAEAQKRVAENDTPQDESADENVAE